MMRIADDFGLGRGHDHVILSLIEAGRLDGTSVMVGGDIAADDVRWLRQLRERGAEVGLHINLTQILPHSGPIWPLGHLLRLALTGGLPDLQLSEQVRRFKDLFGSLPDFYDGHQHCHCFPGVAAQAASLPREQHCWMRIPLPTSIRGRWLNLRTGGAKVAVVMMFAALARPHFLRSGWNVNLDFSGFLQLDDPQQVARWLPCLLGAAGPDCLIMLHPGDAEEFMQCPGHDPRSRGIEAGILTRPP